VRVAAIRNAKLKNQSKLAAGSANWLKENHEVGDK
jgi:hypothetical protein